MPITLSQSTIEISCAPPDVDTGIIDENIKTTEVVNGLLKCVSDLRCVGDIGLEEYPPRAKFSISVTVGVVTSVS